MYEANIAEAKNNFSALVQKIENGTETGIVIMKRNKPIAKIVPVENAPVKRIGVAEGQILYREGWDSPEFNAEIAQMFGVDSCE